MRQDGGVETWRPVAAVREDCKTPLLSVSLSDGCRPRVPGCDWRQATRLETFPLEALTADLSLC